MAEATVATQVVRLIEALEDSEDVPHIRVTSAQSVRVQVDGDLLGEQNEVDFYSVPDALRVAL